MFPRLYSTIAIDAGPVSVAMCQLQRGRGGVCVHRRAVMEDPLRCIGDELQAAEARTQRTLRLIEQGGFRGADASVALKPPDVAFFPARLPDSVTSASRSQCLTVLRFEAARQAQCPPDALEVDFWPLPPGNRMGNNVLIVSVQQSVVERWTNFCAEIGLRLTRVDVAPCAFTRLMRRRAVEGGTEDRALWGILDMGHAHATLTIGMGVTAVYVRPISVTGATYTQAICGALSIDFPTAEMLKRRYAPRPAAVAVPASGTPPGETPRGQRWTDAMAELTAALEPVLRTRHRALAAEVERAFSYVMESYPDAPPGALYLCGGGGRLAGLGEALTDALGVEATLLDPALAGVRSDSGALAGIATCVGLALGDFE
ncbi:MAG: pilus assembly protein PilM [Planctomycetia bacterium]|nr:MAG: pilus assembly protein PilM [Planctomycetia bacterium]